MVTSPVIPKGGRDRNEEGGQEREGGKPERWTARGGRAPDRRTPPRSGSGRPEARRESPGRAVSRDGRFGDPAREGPRPRAREKARRGPAGAVSPLRRLSRSRRLFRPRAGPRAEAHGALRQAGRRLLRSRREEVLHRCLLYTSDAADE